MLKFAKLQRILKLKPLLTELVTVFLFRHYEVCAKFSLVTTRSNLSFWRYRLLDSIRNDNLFRHSVPKLRDISESHYNLA